MPALAVGRDSFESESTLRLVLGEAPLANHHGGLWAGPIL